jgi:hypothetical protein
VDKNLPKLYFDSCCFILRDQYWLRVAAREAKSVECLCGESFVPDGDEIFCPDCRGKTCGECSEILRLDGSCPYCFPDTPRAEFIGYFYDKAMRFEPAPEYLIRARTGEYPTGTTQNPNWLVRHGISIPATPTFTEWDDSQKQTSRGDLSCDT